MNIVMITRECDDGGNDLSVLSVNLWSLIFGFLVFDFDFGFGRSFFLAFGRFWALGFGLWCLFIRQMVQRLSESVQSRFGWWTIH